MRLAVELGEMVERRQVLGGFSDIYGRRIRRSGLPSTGS